MFKYLNFPQNFSVDPVAYHHEEGLFSKGEINWILENVKNVSYQEGTVTEDHSVSSIRKSYIKWLNWMEHSEFEWIYNRLHQAIERANTKYWQFNLYSMPEHIQYTEYYDDGGHYDWHMDMGAGVLSTRKVSITVQLSDPNEYEGGDLQFMRGNYQENAPRGLGTVIVFPSYMLHRVSEITKGTRKSLVLWVGGEHFR
jgi:PKHD-type hydroxylase